MKTVKIKDDYVKAKRAWRAGEKLAEAIIEMVHLMYQNQTALAFLQVLYIKLKHEYDSRNADMVRKKDMGRRPTNSSGGPPA